MNIQIFKLVKDSNRPSPDLATSNKYSEVIIQCLEPKILNEKVDGLFYKIKNE